MDHRVESVIQLLAENPRTTLYDLAHAVHISPSRLQHIFKTETNLSIRAFTQGQLLSQAARLLTETMLNVKEIHNLLGFRDAANFSHSFKKLYGCSPNTYRKMHRITSLDSPFESPRIL
jgi:AraC family transcriptional regulator of arabinose operon